MTPTTPSFPAPDFASAASRFANTEQAQIPGVNSTHFYDYGNLPVRIDRPVSIPHGAPPHKDLQLMQEPKFGVFKLWDAEDAKKLSAVYELIGRGWALLRYDIPQFVSEHNSWVLLVSWVNLYWEIPRNAPVTKPDARPTPPII